MHSDLLVSKTYTALKIRIVSLRYLESAIQLLQAKTLDGSRGSLDLRRRRRTGRQHEDA